MKMLLNYIEERRHATWEEVMFVLEDIKADMEDGGRLLLRQAPPPMTGPASLSVQTDDGYYLPTFMIHEDGVPHVKCIRNEPNRGKEKVCIHGDLYGPTLVTEDFDYIVALVKEFYETGNYTEEFLTIKK